MTIAKHIHWKKVFIGTAFSAVLVLSACNGGNEPAEEPTEDPDTEEAAGEIETDPAEDNEPEPSEDSTEDNDETEEGSGELTYGEGEEELELGETGEIHSTLGTYDVTVSEVSSPDRIDGEAPPEGGTYVVAEVSIKNTSNDPLDAVELSRAFINNKETGTSLEKRSYFEEINNFEGEIPPGETMSGQLSFVVADGSAYQIELGSNAYSNVLKWNFELPALNNES
ncbi:DUF4352 domain-containing protein [Bacillaceae bacterium SIJ1]|uniref:DUF4352 domain-containing protein n=1 Tax=Litoribacterium kuwaitense TaxID=1398745 RepID=UPI0013ED4246|nr:DUF4352 domain-containing protein [Litoribacterium kuwaitense]NGP44445.1 DUF4352 domain-containing protein [Litoribacterium kuwaitense]